MLPSPVFTLWSGSGDGFYYIQSLLAWRTLGLGFSLRHLTNNDHKNTKPTETNLHHTHPMSLSAMSLKFMFVYVWLQECIKLQHYPAVWWSSSSHPQFWAVEWCRCNGTLGGHPACTCPAHDHWIRHLPQRPTLQLQGFPGHVRIPLRLYAPHWWTTDRCFSGFAIVVYLQSSSAPLEKS